MTDTNTNTNDTKPNAAPSPESLEGYEPPVDGEDQRAKRARKMRNRRRAEKAAREAAPEQPASRPVGRPAKASKRADSVTGILSGVGIAVMAFEPNDGMAIIEGAADLGQALSNLADKNAKVAKALDALNETSAWAEVAVAVGGIAVPILRNHGLFGAPKQTEQASPPAARESNSGSNTPEPPKPSTADTIRTTADGAIVFAARADA